MSRPTLSVCLIVKDCAPMVPHLLANLEGLGDEIVVMDSFSSDGTVELFERHPEVRLVQRPFENFGDQKNAVFDEARGDWILNVDQDELLGDHLRAAIPELVESRRVTHYKFPRYWILSGPPWRYVDSDKHYPDHQIRLFRNEARFRFGTGHAVHHHFPREGRGPAKRLGGKHVFHFDFVVRSRALREEKVRFYTELDPTSTNTHRMALYEEFDFCNRLCREPLTAPGLAASSALASSGTSRGAAER